MMTPAVYCASAIVEGPFTDPTAAWFEFVSLCNGIAGMTVLTSTRFDFPGGGVSGIVVIAESHAALHTWPELGRAGVELATCGVESSVEEFKHRIERKWRVVGGWQYIRPRRDG